LAYLFDPERTLYPQSDHLSTTDRAQGRESLPAKGRRPNR